MIDCETKENIMGKLASLTGGILSSLVYDDDCKDEDQDFSYISDKVNAYDCRCGRSKLVLEFYDNDDYVVKIPIKKHVERGIVERYDCAFLHDPHDNPDDYCKIEKEMYEVACKSGVEDMFAGTWKIGDIDGYPIYASEKVDYTFEEVDKDWILGELDIEFRPFTELDEDIKKMGYKTNMFLSYDAIDLIIQQNGIDKTKELMKFLSMNNITDLHSGNVGIDSDGKVKIIDYPGFFG